MLKLKYSLIGIAGKKGSGKDTFAQMLNYYQELAHEGNKYHTEFSKEDFLSWVSMMEDGICFKGNWTGATKNMYLNRKFGAKLKQIAAILLSCDEKDFEDRDFKDKELSPEWWYYRRLDNPTAMYPYTEHESFRGDPKYILIKPTGRTFLQTLGTEAGRNVIHPNVWLTAMFTDSRTEEEKEADWWYTDNHIITDVRFINELEKIRSLKGLTIRVNLIGSENADAHSSETELDNEEFDIVINASYGIDNLWSALQKVIPLIYDEQ